MTSARAPVMEKSSLMRTILVLLLVLAVSGCATTPEPGPATARETVVLVQDDDGKVGQITVTTRGGAKLLSVPNTMVEVSGAGESPSDPKKMDQRQIDSMFAGSLKSLPLPPISFQLYFMQNSAKLTSESKTVLPVILTMAKTRGFYEISVIGHTDTTGRDDYNMKLSSARARAVSNALVSYGFPADQIEIRYHGSRDPLIPTGDNVKEPRNRRVEVIIK